ncbi:MAG: DUF4476 domain-containing protein [Flavobacteriales bacterium]|nr:DUF4476 domain-containing protein [Flavobacteriales bacterium]
MKQLYIIALAASLSNSVVSARPTSDIIVFSDAGEPFTLVVDGVVRNSRHATRVEARGISGSTPLFMVDLADAGIAPIHQGGWEGSGLGYTLCITTTTKVASAPGTNTKAVDPVQAGGCGHAMAASDFQEAKTKISSKGSDDTKLMLAKQIAGSNCLSTSQVKAVMNLFSFEDSKLDFAKYAYDHASDRNNYYHVNEAFGSTGSVEELNSYIQGR